jgi:regulator of replication initiation timing
MQTRQIQIPVEAQGLINELKAQNAMLVDRCGMLAADNAALNAQNEAFRAELGKKQQASEERKAARKFKDGAASEADAGKTGLV